MRQYVRNTVQVACMLCLLAMSALLYAEAGPPPTSPPDVGPSLVREGSLALSLQQALGLGSDDEESAAESSLAEVGIVPRNGWIADYPVTPDIVGELYKSVRDAAAADRIPMGVEEAIRRLDGVMAQEGLAIKPGDTAKPANPANPPVAPVPSDLGSYYAEEGPPVVTYYAPPQPYYSLYAWVPYPFWWGGFWFNGFFVLNDFHRPVFIGDRPFFISNHFRDIRRHRVFRIDPYQRYRGQTYSGIGIRNRRGLSTGVPRSDRTIFNRSPSREDGSVPGGRSIGPRRGGAPGGRTDTTPGNRSVPGRTQTSPRGGAAPGGVQGTPRSGGTSGGRIESGPRSGGAAGGSIESAPRGPSGGRTESVPRGGGMISPPAGRGDGFERGGGGIERGGGGFERGGGGMRR